MPALPTLPTAPSSPPTTPGGAPAEGLAVTVARTAQALEQHAEAWYDLAANAVEPNPFFEPHALLAAWRYLGAPELQVVLVWAANPQHGQPPQLAGLFPCVTSRRYQGLPLVALGIWSHHYAYLGTPLVRARLADAVLEAVFAWLRAQTDAAVFEWSRISADGPFCHALIDTLNRRGLESFRARSYTRAVFRPAATAEAYLARALGGTKRRYLRRQERRLAETGPMTYDELAPDGDLDAWLDEFVALEARGWKGQGGTALRGDPAALATFRAMARGAFARGGWMTLALRLGGRAIAMKCNLRAGAGAVAFKIAYDEDYARFSPGVLLELEQVRRLHRAGAPAWMDSGAASDHPMIGHLWRDRQAFETVVVPTGRAPGGLAVAAMPLARWGSRTLREVLRRLRPRPRP